MVDILHRVGIKSSVDEVYQLSPKSSLKPNPHNPHISGDGAD